MSDTGPVVLWFYQIICFHIQIAEFTKECSAKWRELDGNGKKPFEAQAAADKARYDREVICLIYVTEL